MTTQSSLDAFFHPQSIAVVGVSRDETSVGNTIYDNILKEGYRGIVFPVNPFIREFQGVECFPSVLSIPQPVDLAIIVVPSAIVPSVLEEIGKKRISSAIIISSGFREIGSDGLQREKLIKNIAERYHISIVGPNCLGVIHPHDKLNASFARTTPIPGSIALLSQSGALGSALLDIITPKRIGLSHFISLGNKADINELDCLEYLSNDDKTNVIGMYVEELGDAQKLIAVGKKFASGQNPKPIVVLKGGRTKEGTEAVHSHTGSLSGEPQAYWALFRQACMLEVKSTQEFINALVSFSQNPLPRGNSCAIVTNAGGPAILATDTLVTCGVDVTPVSGKSNPIDLLGDANASVYQKTLSELEQNVSVHSILGIVTPQAVTEIADTANAFCIHKKTSKKPLAVSWMGDLVMKEGKQILEMGNVPSSKYPEQTALMLANLHHYTAMRTRLTAVQTELIKPYKSISSPINPMDPLSLLKSFGIPVPAYVLVKDIESIPSAISSLGEKIVLKFISKQIIHKSDLGAVRLNVLKQRGREVAVTMLEQVQKFIPNFIPEGILCMDMVDTTDGIECIIGIKKEIGLGTLIMLGIGGIFVEVMKDVSFRFAPLTQSDAQDMIDDLKSKVLIDGFRGKKPLDKKALIQTLLTVSQLSVNHTEITELDINPLVVFPKGIVALDTRITVESTQ